MSVTEPEEFRDEGAGAEDNPDTYTDVDYEAAAWIREASVEEPQFTPDEVAVMPPPPDDEEEGA